MFIISRMFNGQGWINLFVCTKLTGARQKYAFSRNKGYFYAGLPTPGIELHHMQLNAFYMMRMVFES
jgi:hypothetical protein